METYHHAPLLLRPTRRDIPWYVSVVSIFFDCSMPILFNFHILLATFYTIFGTNILIQCPVPVPVCCMFYVSQKIHIKRSPIGIKTDRVFFGIFVNFGKKNQHETVPEGPTRQGARLEGGGRTLLSRGRLGCFLACTPSPLDDVVPKIMLPKVSFCFYSVSYSFSSEH